MESNNREDIYDTQYVSSLFDKMSKTYGITNYISSFGFTERWRKQCVREIDWGTDVKKGYDLMSGMGESWHLILKESNVKITGVDISREMNKKAKRQLTKNKDWEITIREENVLDNQMESETADFIISTFGLKTFSKEQLKLLAKEIARMLRKGGQFSMIEISEPKNWMLRMPYMFYLKSVIPIIGKLFQGDSANYKMLGTYCEQFKNCAFFKAELEKIGLTVELKSYFYGCATGVVGYK